MVHIEGKYKLDKNENYIELLKVAGVPEDHAKIADQERATLTVKVEGKKYTWKYDGLKTYEATLIDGEEVEENMPLGQTFLSTTKVEGNALRIKSKDNNSKKEMERLYTFSDSGLTVVITLDSGLKATRYYKRI